MTRRDRHAGDLGGLAVDADGVDVAAEDGAAAADMGDDGERERDHHRLGDEGEDVAALDRRLDLFAEIERDEVARAEPARIRRAG